MHKNIVIPVDLNDKNSIKAVLPPVLDYVKAFGSTIHFIHIMPDFGMKTVEEFLPKSWMNEQKKKYIKLLEEMASKNLPDDVDVYYHIGRGAIYDEIIKYSENVDADLIMISAVRPQLRDYMLGPNASKIVRHSSISVMVIRN